MNIANADTDENIVLTSSFSAFMRTPYFFLISNPSSKASIESKPNPSLNRGSELLISSIVKSSRSWFYHIKK
jgi:hypothetical protein